jgi:DNA polymerase III epsilon subunit-like protein
VQIAWLQYDGQGKKISEQCHIIKPEGYSIPKDAADIHGITTQRAEREGVALRTVLTAFSELINQARFLVAHNMSFDEKIVGAEFLRTGVGSRLFQTGKICTMEAATDFCALPGPYGYKWPKLSELHIKLFARDFEEAHDASVDGAACAKCFWELKKRGII